MAISITYSYKVEASFVLDGKEHAIIPETIGSVITNYDYDNNNIPIIYLGVRLDTVLYNKMLLNSERATITLTISKCKNTGNNSIYTNYIKDTFTYTMSTNPDYNETIEKESNTHAQIGTNYREGHIALIQSSVTDNNKKIVNTIIKNSNMASIIHKFTSHMKMVMEPLHVNKQFNYLIIPPIESVAKLLKYLNRQSIFYKGGYRYFVDFDKTYLLGAQGNPVDARDGSYSTVVINITDPTEDIASQTGIITDHKTRSYILNMNANNTITQVKKTEDKIFNKIIGVDSYGNTRELVLDIPKTEGSSDKIRLERVPSDNLDYTDYLKDNIESSVIMFSVTKTEIDSSLITPNKEYIVRNYPTFSEYNGRYVLSYKKELFIAQGEGFISSIIFGLRKVKDR